jgi:SAM-dependent methyltransferase
MQLKYILKKLRRRLSREAFYPSWLGTLINPIYIVRRGLFKTIQSFSPAISGKVLDFGCGTKPYESLFSNASHYTGVDIEICGHNHVDSKVDVFYDGKTLPFADGSFDSVVSFEVLEHIFNINEILSEVSRVLKPGGRFLLSIPFAWEEHEIPYDFARYTTYGIEFVLRESGFDVVQTVKTTTSVLAINQLFIAYLAKYVSPQSRFPAIVFQLFIIFPITTISILINSVLPKQYGYFCNCVVLCELRT